MIRTLPSLLAISLLSTVPALAQIPNGSFEDWTTLDTYVYPDHWLNSNSFTAVYFGITTCEEGTPGAAGNAYARITSKGVSDQGVMSGYLITRAMPVAGENVEAGFPFTDRPDALHGQWQYGIQPTDSGYVGVAVSKWNPATQVHDIIGEGTLFIPEGTVSTWESFSVPLTYSSPLTPDTALIMFFSSISMIDDGTATGVEGSFMLIDDLQFSGGGSMGFAETNLRTELTIAPSPARDELQVRTTLWIADITVTDMAGRQVMEHHANAPQAVLGIGTLQPGTYLLTAHMADGQRMVSKFMKE